jgi:DNA replication protein DnaC
MLIQPTIEKLHKMKLAAMARAFQDQLATPGVTALAFEERFGLLVDRQLTELENRRMQNRLKTAKLRLSACVEDLDFSPDRELDRSLIMSLTTNRWVAERHHILITGPTGAGKSYLACALAQHACRDGHTTLYHRIPRLFSEIAVARLDGRYHNLMATLFKCEVLVLDDLFIAPISHDEQKELLEIIEERYQRKATIVTSQVAVKAWHGAMPDPTLSDAILDRLVHNAYLIPVKGDSMRKKKRLQLDRQPAAMTE